MEKKKYISRTKTPLDPIAIAIKSFKLSGEIKTCSINHGHVKEGGRKRRIYWIYRWMNACRTMKG